MFLPGYLCFAVLLGTARQQKSQTEPMRTVAAKMQIRITCAQAFFVEPVPQNDQGNKL